MLPICTKECANLRRDRCTMGSYNGVKSALDSCSQLLSTKSQNPTPLFFTTYPRFIYTGFFCCQAFIHCSRCKPISLILYASSTATANSQELRVDLTLLQGGSDDVVGYGPCATWSMMDSSKRACEGPGDGWRRTSVFDFYRYAALKNMFGIFQAK